MTDIILMYSVAWVIFMVFGVIGFLITKGSAWGYLIFQVMIAGIVLLVLRDTFGAMDTNIWIMYALGFASYTAAFLVGAKAYRIGGVMSFQVLAFAITVMLFPYMFGVI